jgi:hypothetical protein
LQKQKKGQGLRRRREAIDHSVESSGLLDKSVSGSSL